MRHYTLFLFLFALLLSPALSKNALAATVNYCSFYGFTLGSTCTEYEMDQVSCSTSTTTWSGGECVGDTNYGICKNGACKVSNICDYGGGGCTCVPNSVSVVSSCQTCECSENTSHGGHKATGYCLNPQGTASPDYSNCTCDSGYLCCSDGTYGQSSQSGTNAYGSWSCTGSC